MLLHSAQTLPGGEDWAFEPKWDGFRCLAHLGEATRLVSRRGRDLLSYVPELAHLHERVPASVVLDAEVVAVRGGKPSFDALRRRVFGPAGGPEAPAVLVVFDLLLLGGRSVMALSYERRRRILQGLGVEGPGMQLTVAYPASEGPALFQATREQGLEGVVAKRLGSPYRAGVRSRDWVKVKHFHTGQFAVGGWLPDGAGRLRAILLGRWVKDGLAYAGAVEFGFSRRGVQAELEALAVREPVLLGAPRLARAVRPALRANIKYQALTEDGRVRAATVLGFRR
jgi:bifunctional non-homologous end joining protein LigD